MSLVPPAPEWSSGEILPKNRWEVLGMLREIEDMGPNLQAWWHMPRISALR